MAKWDAIVSQLVKTMTRILTGMPVFFSFPVSLLHQGDALLTKLKLVVYKIHPLCPSVHGSHVEP